MKPTPPHLLAKWARCWQIAGAFLDRERAERLRNMTDDEARAAIAAIFCDGAVRPSIAASEETERENGLVEQQRLFRKLRKEAT